MYTNRDSSPRDWNKMTLHPGSLRYSSTWWSRSSARRPEMASCCTNGVPAGTYYTRRWAVPIFCQKNLAAMQAPWTTWIIWMRSWIPTNTLLSSENAQKMIQFSQMFTIYMYLLRNTWKEARHEIGFPFPWHQFQVFGLARAFICFSLFLKMQWCTEAQLQHVGFKIRYSDLVQCVVDLGSQRATAFNHIGPNTPLPSQKQMLPRI